MLTHMCMVLTCLTLAISPDCTLMLPWPCLPAPGPNSASLVGQLCHSMSTAQLCPAETSSDWPLEALSGTGPEQRPFVHNVQPMAIISLITLCSQQVQREIKSYEVIPPISEWSCRLSRYSSSPHQH